MLARVRASGIHFGISACLIALFLCVVFLIWYPYPYYEIYSTWNVIKIVAGVDVILGPLLTFVVFNTVKKRAELKRDLLLIVFVQLVALGWGIHVTYSVRPLYMVFSNGTFYTFTAKDVDVSLLTRKELEPEVFDKPRLVYVKPPQNAEEYRQIYKDMMHQDKKDIMFRTSRYLPVEDYLDRIYLFAINVNDISHSDMKQINNFIEQQGGQLDDYAFYPLKGGQTYATLVLNKKTDSIAGIINKVLGAGGD